MGNTFCRAYFFLVFISFVFISSVQADQSHGRIVLGRRSHHKQTTEKLIQDINDMVDVIFKNNYLECSMQANSTADTSSAVGKEVMTCLVSRINSKIHDNCRILKILYGCFKDELKYCRKGSDAISMIIGEMLKTIACPPLDQIPETEINIGNAIGRKLDPFIVSLPLLVLLLNLC